jgi:nucleolar protein 14
LNLTFALPSLSAASEVDKLSRLHLAIEKFKGDKVPPLSLEKASMEDAVTSVSLLIAVLQLVSKSVEYLAGAVSEAEREMFADITKSILEVVGEGDKHGLPTVIRKQIALTVSIITNGCKLDQCRRPLQRRTTITNRKKEIKSLAPRVENPDKYSGSLDKGKSATQVALDRTRREYKREHRAVSRELRLDGSFVENERRTEQNRKTSIARTQRQKNFSWMENEQGTMNQQVAQGGGLLKGGGIGAARAKAKSGRLGMKKGGKFR